MQKKSLLLIVIIGLLTFSVTLFNDFVGDDTFIIVNNSMYQTWKNFPLLFTKDYLSNSSEIFNASGADLFHSGSVAYRPVLSATYFFDYWIGKVNPLGYHLHNVFLHILNSLLVYLILFQILKKKNLALLSAVIFCIHPLKCEPVSSIGYRADSLACFFLLLSFLSYARFPDFKGAKQSIIFLLSHAFFFLSLFAKESALVFPAIIFVYDRFIRDEKSQPLLKGLATRYMGFVFILFFYLFIYFKVFPNETLKATLLMGGSLTNHFFSILNIFVFYVIAFLLPFRVRMLPPYHLIDLKPFLSFNSVLVLVVLGFFIYLIFSSYKNLFPLRDLVRQQNHGRNDANRGQIHKSVTDRRGNGDEI